MLRTTHRISPPPTVRVVCKTKYIESKKVIPKIYLYMMPPMAIYAMNENEATARLRCLGVNVPGLFSRCRALTRSTVKDIMDIKENIPDVRVSQYAVDKTYPFPPASFGCAAPNIARHRRSMIVATTKAAIQMIVLRTVWPPRILKRRAMLAIRLNSRPTD